MSGFIIYWQLKNGEWFCNALFFINAEEIILLYCESTVNFSLVSMTAVLVWLLVIMLMLVFFLQLHQKNGVSMTCLFNLFNSLHTSCNNKMPCLHNRWLACSCSWVLMQCSFALACYQFTELYFCFYKTHYESKFHLINESKFNLIRYLSSILQNDEQWQQHRNMSEHTKPLISESKQEAEAETRSYCLRCFGVKLSR